MDEQRPEIKDLSRNQLDQMKNESDLNKALEALRLKKQFKHIKKLFSKTRQPYSIKKIKERERYYKFYQSYIDIENK